MALINCPECGTEVSDKAEKLLQHPFNLLSDIDKIKSLHDELSNSNLITHSLFLDTSVKTSNINKQYIEFLIADHVVLFGAKSYSDSLSVQMISYGMCGLEF